MLTDEENLRKEGMKEGIREQRGQQRSIIILFPKVALLKCTLKVTQIILLTIRIEHKFKPLHVLRDTRTSFIFSELVRTSTFSPSAGNDELCRGALRTGAAERTRARGHESTKSQKDSRLLAGWLFRRAKVLSRATN